MSKVSKKFRWSNGSAKAKIKPLDDCIQKNTMKTELVQPIDGKREVKSIMICTTADNSTTLSSEQIAK